MSNPDDPKLRRDRKSSSILLSAFRTLTAGRKPPTSLQSPPLSVTDSAVSGLAATISDANSPDVRPVEVDVVAPLDKPTPSLETNETVPVEELPKTQEVYGAPPELVHLITQLQTENPIAVRTQAAYKICRFLEKYPVQEVLTIWTLGSDLRLDPSSDAAQYGFELLISCIKAAELTATERKLFWESIHTYEGVNHLDLRLLAATTLSDDGHKIECMEEEIVAFLSKILKIAYLNAVAMRRKHPKSGPDPNSPDEQMLARIFQFTTNVIKFNSVTLKDADFEIIIARLYSICSSTSTTIDISNALQIISHLATFTNISPTSFQPCLDLLCGIYKQVSKLKESTWIVWKRVFESNLKSAAIVYLFNILQTADKKEITVQGAFHVLRDLAINDGKDGLPNISLSNLAPVVNTLLRGEGKYNLEMDVLAFYETVLADPTFRRRLIDDVDWMYFQESLTHCSEALQDSLSVKNRGNQGDPHQTPNKKSNDPNSPEAARLFNGIVQYLCDVFTELNVIHQEEAAILFFHLGSSLSDNAARTLLSYLASRPFLTSRPLDDYLRIWTHLVLNYAQDTSRPASLRKQTYEHMTGRFDEVQYLPEVVVTEFVMLLVEDLDKESDPEVLEILASFVAKVLKSEHRQPLFPKVFNKVREAIFYRQRSTAAILGRRPSTSPASINRSSDPSLCRIVVRHIIRLFLGLINESAEHAEEIYRLMIDVAGEHGLEPDARICALKLLFRLRSTGEHRLYVAPISESESIAKVLCRTEDTKVSIEDPTETPKETRNSSTGSVPTTKSKAINIKRTVPPLWFYPGPKALPSEPPKEPSLVLFAGPPAFPTPGRKIVVLKIALWLEMVLSILQQPNVNWEVYSYVLVHLGSQLKNQMFFTMAIPHVKMLRNVVCEQIRAQSFHEPPSYTSLRKADVAVCLFHVLTMLIGYNSHFAKSEEDEMIRSFVLGIGSWEGTSKWCIHALSVCCHELPLSISKSLDGIIQKMSTIITRTGVAIHILEFLCGVARMPDLYKNFTEEEYRTVFGVAFKYLQYVHDQRQREADSTQRAGLTPVKTKRFSENMRELKRQPSDPNLRAKSSLGRGEDLPQYVHALAYHVITFWFMALKLRDRPTYVQQIAKNLTYYDSNGNNAIEEQGLVTLDMMERIAYTDRDETVEQVGFAKETDGEVSEKTWIIGMSLLTIQTAGRTGLSQIIRRRPVSAQFILYIHYMKLTFPSPEHTTPFIAHC
jgi:hypothetical protein